MCGCIVALLALLSPRLAIFALWAFTDRMSIAFDSFWWAAIGFFFLPWTTLAWAVAYAPVRGVEGFGWFVVGLGFVVDISTYLGSAKARSEQAAAA